VETFIKKTSLDSWNLFAKNFDRAYVFAKKFFMDEGKQEVLTLIAFFSPNLVGTETYLDNLASILSKSGIRHTISYADLSKKLCVDCYTVDSIEQVCAKLETLNTTS